MDKGSTPSPERATRREAAMTTLTDHGLLDAWGQRRVALDKLALMRVYRASICGCLRCGDLDRAEELDALIARCVEAVDELTDAITDGVLVSASLPA